MVQNNAGKKIIIGCDHAGLSLKSTLKNLLNDMGYNVLDVGTDTNESCNYPVIAKSACKYLIEDIADKCILICGTGIGMSIAANKIKGIRAAVVSDTTSAKLSRLHNDTNVLCLGERIIGEELAKDIVTEWLSTEFLQGRHKIRVDMLED